MDSADQKTLGRIASIEGINKKYLYIVVSRFDDRLINDSVVRDSEGILSNAIREESEKIKKRILSLFQTTDQFSQRMNNNIQDKEKSMDDNIFITSSTAFRA
jgi:hypothetical protein